MLSTYEKLFGKYDIRGRAGDGMGEEFARELGFAFTALVCPGGGSILVGHDVRANSNDLAEAFCLGARSAGSSVVNLGLASTPRITYHGALGAFDGMVSITASHLGPEHNGFKLFRQGAIPLGVDGSLSDLLNLQLDASDKGEQHESAALDDSRLTAAGEPRLSSYIGALLAGLRIDRPLRVAIDPGHGATCEEVRLLKEEAAGSIEMSLLNSEPDGSFPDRSPNPLDGGALEALKRCVVENGLDFGVALDGDGDRAVFVDDGGSFIPTDQIAGLLAGEFGRRQPGCTVAYDFRSTRALAEYATFCGAKCQPVGVGYPIIIRAMRSQNAAFAGELSGHYYYGDLHFTDNGLRTFIEVAGIVSRGGKTLSELLQPLRKYATSGEINLRVDAADDVLMRLESAFAGGVVERIDGIAVNFSDWWFCARASHTEPVVRITVGAKDEASLEANTEEVLSVARLSAAML